MTNVTRRENRIGGLRAVNIKRIRFYRIPDLPSLDIR